MNEQKELFDTEQDKHRERILDAVKGFHRGHTRARPHKIPAVGINTRRSSILAVVDAHGTGFTADKRQDEGLPPPMPVHVFGAFKAHIGSHVCLLFVRKFRNKNVKG